MKFLTSELETDTVVGCKDQASADMTGQVIMGLLDSLNHFPRHIAHSALGNAFMIFSLNNGLDRQAILDFINTSLDMNEKRAPKGDLN